jgi:hypothetical protein
MSAFSSSGVGGGLAGGEPWRTSAPAGAEVASSAATTVAAIAPVAAARRPARPRGAAPRTGRVCRKGAFSVDVLGRDPP